ncbi:hypothetical protein CDG60_14655 [Acinetobacter chinensis]|uniref:Uncharacterized protein n=1 Tax=Acinetobacter chinensis TaxID=2004650 RepID=A0A3B7M0I9_9GAMM|nr:hypothetical protein [Acinetobacter chinensis]AXY57694.1 hypothetical protein CDG60_14655 [Acinetobacter chinensis]
MVFNKHPSEQLEKLFNSKPYQGQQPEKAKIIFLSSDANYSEEISTHHFFNRIIEYHEDGIKFWQKYQVHHPFLLDEYPFKKNQGGVPFHKRFKSVGLTSEYAKEVCFLELLDIPTIGSMSKDKKLFLNLINPDHLKKIDKVFQSDAGQLIFVSKNVIQFMHLLKKKYKVFDWLEPNISKVGDSVKIKSNQLLVIYHFSASVETTYRQSLKTYIDEILS